MSIRSLPLLFLLLLPVVLPGQDSASPPESLPFPTPRQWAQTRKLRGAGALTEADEDAIPSTETLFVHQEKEERWIWGPRGSYKATIKIPRYFGSREQILTMARNGLMPAKATLIIPAHDCDSHDEGKPTIMPEVDMVYLNGHYLGTLKGDTDHLDYNLLSVPLEWIHFPGAPGETAENHLEILVDTANDTSIWVLGQLWQALFIPAPSPVLLVHGWTDLQDMLSDFATQLTQSLGVPSHLAYVPQFASPDLNAMLLQQQLASLTQRWGVRKFHVVGHSKGGLDARVLIDAVALASPQVKSVLQISTPNQGSRVADVISYPSGLLEKSFSLLADKVADARRSSPGFRSLRTEDCLRFNQIYRSPTVPLRTIMGMVETDNLPTTYKTLVKLSHLPTPNDGVVTVASAHALRTQVPESPLDSQDTSLYDHSSIVRAGAPEVIRILGRFLQEEVEEILQTLPHTPKTRSATTTAAEEETPDAALPTRSWTFLLSGGEPGQRRLPLAPGPVTLLLLSAAQGTQGELQLPGEEVSHSLDTLPADETPFFEGAPLWGEFSAGLSGEAILTLRAPEQATPRLVTLLCQGNFTQPARELLLENVTPARTPPPGELLLQVQCPEDEDGPLLLEWEAFSLDAPQEKLPGEWLCPRDEGSLHEARFSPRCPGTWEILVTAPCGDGETLASRLVVQTYGGSVQLSTPWQERLQDTPQGGKDLLFETTVTVSLAGRYALTGTLATQDGKTLLLRGDQWLAQAGIPQACQLRFEEEALPRPAGDTPWMLTNLQLTFLGDGESTITPIPLATWTEPQTVTPESREYYRGLSWGATLPGTGQERILPSGNTLGARLEITLDILPLLPPEGNTMPAATLPLYSPGGQWLGQASGNPRRTENGSWQVTVTYPRHTLLHAQEDGPYVIRDAFLSRTNDQEEEEIAPVLGSYTTAAYSRFLFHDASLLSTHSPSAHLQWEVTLLQGEEAGEPETSGQPALQLSFTRPPLVSAPAPAPSPGETFLLFFPYGTQLPPFLAYEAYTLEDMSGYVQDITEEVRSLLPSLGNGDALLDEGETLELLLPLARELEEGEEGKLALWILTREDSYVFQQAQTVLHPLDLDGNLRLTAQEVEQGRKQWRKGTLASEILLNGLYLREYFYQYAPARRRHERVP